MPNWCEGTLRLRGTKQNIIAFLENELEMLGPYNDEKRDYDILDMKIVDHDGMDWQEFVYPKKDAVDIYIKGTHRNFLTNLYDMYLKPEGVCSVCLNNFRAAWWMDPVPYMAFSKKYGIDIKLTGSEQGMRFEQIIEIAEGNLVRDDELKYKDWAWEAMFPNMGG